LRIRALTLAAPLAAAALLAGCGGGSSSTSSEASAPFAPHATLKSVGGTTRTSKPAITLDVTAHSGEANIRSAKVELPPVALVDAESIRRLCARSELESKNCAGRQALGSAEVVSPSFGEPLKGPVYVVSGPGAKFHLAYVLGGPTELVLEGAVESENGTIGAGIENVPDTPIRSFVLKIAGGKTGYLVLDRDICAGKIAPATVTYESQEGQSHEEKVPLQAECG
jgi:hypothetical protein